MNYRHHFHAGNFADVVKHVLLGALFRGMQRKEKGFLYLDTHAGRGKYDLHVSGWGQSSPRMAEHPNGWGMLEEARLNVPQFVEDYRNAVRGFDRRWGNLDGKLRFYPGSPCLAIQWMRPQDRLVLCELNRNEYEVLAREMEGRRHVSVQHLDGYVAVRAFLPPKERRALVLVDPPFESPDEWLNLAQCVGETLERMPDATIAMWHPITERAGVEQFLDELVRMRPPPAWTASVTVRDAGMAAGMRGCGVLVVNPPWRLDEELRPVVIWLADQLAQAHGAQGSLSWLVPER